MLFCGVDFSLYMFEIKIALYTIKSDNTFSINFIIYIKKIYAVLSDMSKMTRSSDEEGNFAAWVQMLVSKYIYHCRWRRSGYGSYKFAI